MSDTYTKLFRSIAASTIVSEPLATRWLWVTMLSQADKAGKVYASVPGLARMANISLAECEAGLQCFLSPDAYSRTADNEGRRIEAFDGGWRLLNHAKYDAMRNEAERLEKKREWDRKNRPSGHQRTKATGSDSQNEIRQSDSSPPQSDETRQSGPISHSSFLIPQQEQKQERASPNGSRLPADFAMPDEWLAWARAERPDVDVDREAKNFTDHWHAKAGKDARKADWLATWRKWIRSDYVKSSNPRAGPPQPQPVGKQMQGLMALEAMKSGNRMAAGRDSDRAAKAPLLVAGSHPSG